MSGAGKAILFVADRPEVAQQPVLRLQLEGHAVTEAHSREDGLAQLDAQAFDLLILDAELPGGDGWQVLQEFQAHPAFAQTKVVVLMAGKGETGKLVMVPVDAEIRRPFTMAELMDAVQRVLGPDR